MNSSSLFHQWSRPKRIRALEKSYFTYIYCATPLWYHTNKENYKSMDTQQWEDIVSITKNKLDYLLDLYTDISTELNRNNILRLRVLSWDICLLWTLLVFLRYKTFGDIKMAINKHGKVNKTNKPTNPWTQQQMSLSVINWSEYVIKGKR